MYDGSYLKKLTKWIENHQLWERGEHPDRKNAEVHQRCRYYAEWGGDPPRVEDYMPDWPEEERTAFALYETVSEGTPLTPAFSTKEELIQHLVKCGDSWGNRWTQKQAERFVLDTGGCPSAVTVDGKLVDPRDI